MTNAEQAILGLVVEQPRHGYEIEGVIETRGMRDWTEIGFSSIYYLLKKLEDKGLVKAELAPAEGRGPARKVYAATEEGRSVWARQSLEILHTPAHQPTPFLLGLAALPAFPLDDVLGALESRRKQLQERLDDMLASAARQQPLPPHVAAMFDYSQTLLEAEIGWLADFITAQKD
ncbi:MAG: PadR family transcriptional regulator [Anaerolineales bacterium]